ncbi:MAG TPA: hypothetical protein PL124_07155 [Candidatus Cloacimonadota bacterium]|nr:hypothetical protein [Candidatus Cloacimonadota bacterium]
MKAFQLDEDDSFEKQLVEIAKLHRERNSQYFISPLEILPVEDFLAQVSIKGCRANQAVTSAKVVDELKDTAVYAIMVLEQIDKRGWERPGEPE